MVIDPIPDQVTGAQVIFQLTIEVKEKMYRHSREIYGVLALFGDFGGLKEVLSLIIELLVAPWAEHIFFIVALKKLFLLKTDDKVFSSAISDSGS